MKAALSVPAADWLTFSNCKTQKTRGWTHYKTRGRRRAVSKGGTGLLSPPWLILVCLSDLYEQLLHMTHVRAVSYMCWFKFAFKNQFPLQCHWQIIEKTQRSNGASDERWEVPSHLWVADVEIALKKLRQEGKRLGGGVNAHIHRTQKHSDLLDFWYNMAHDVGGNGNFGVSFLSVVHLNLSRCLCFKRLMMHRITKQQTITRISSLWLCQPSLFAPNLVAECDPDCPNTDLNGLTQRFLIQIWAP